MTTARTIKIINLLFWSMFMACCIIRNTPSPGLRSLTAWFDRKILTQLGFFHRGWSMFPYITNGASLARHRFIYTDGHEVIYDYFPLRSRWYPDVMNEVMEDLSVRDDNGDTTNQFRNGYLEYSCAHTQGPYASSGPLKQIVIESAFVRLHELFTNYGEPYAPLTYSPIITYTCKNS